MDCCHFGRRYRPTPVERVGVQPTKREGLILSLSFTLRLNYFENYPVSFYMFLYVSVFTFLPPLEAWLPYVDASILLPLQNGTLLELL
jgi:hypothetical protein